MFALKIRISIGVLLIYNHGVRACTTLASSPIKELLCRLGQITKFSLPPSGWLYNKVCTSGILPVCYVILYAFLFFCFLLFVSCDKLLIHVMNFISILFYWFIYFFFLLINCCFIHSSFSFATHKLNIIATRLAGKSIETMQCKNQFTAAIFSKKF